jgi:hypothetical protein
MRTLFLLLVLGNLAFFAWTHYFPSGEGLADPQPAARQIDPESVRILSSQGTPAPRPAPQKPATEVIVSACTEWGSFSSADALLAEQALAGLNLGPRLTQRRSEDIAGWWVYMQPQGGRQGAQKKTTELKALGVEEYFILQEDGPFRFAVSLGVFRTEEAAKARLEALRARGVRTALVGKRDTPVQKVWFQVRPVEESVAARLKDLMQSVPGGELRDCPAAPSA